MAVFPWLDGVAVGDPLVELALRRFWIPLSGWSIWCFDVPRAVPLAESGGGPLGGGFGAVGGGGQAARAGLAGPWGHGGQQQRWERRRKQRGRSRGGSSSAGVGTVGKSRGGR